MFHINPFKLVTNTPQGRTSCILYAPSIKFLWWLFHVVGWGVSNFTLKELILWGVKVEAHAKLVPGPKQLPGKPHIP